MYKTGYEEKQEDGTMTKHKNEGRKKQTKLYCETTNTHTSALRGTPFCTSRSQIPDCARRIKRELSVHI